MPLFGMQPIYDGLEQLKKSIAKSDRVSKIALIISIIALGIAIAEPLIIEILRK